MNKNFSGSYVYTNENPHMKEHYSKEFASVEEREASFNDAINKAVTMGLVELGLPTDSMLVEFARALMSHDWYYARSDDHSVYTKGANNTVKLSAMFAEVEKVYGNEVPNKLHDEISPFC